MAEPWNNVIIPFPKDTPKFRFVLLHEWGLLPQAIINNEINIMRAWCLTAGSGHILWINQSVLGYMMCPVLRILIYWVYYKSFNLFSFYYAYICGEVGYASKNIKNTENCANWQANHIAYSVSGRHWIRENRFNSENYPKSFLHWSTQTGRIKNLFCGWIILLK